MTITKSLKTKLDELEELLKFHELSEWEFNFITNNADRVRKGGGDTTKLSEKVVDKIEELWERRCN